MTNMENPFAAMTSPQAAESAPAPAPAETAPVETAPVETAPAPAEAAPVTEEVAPTKAPAKKATRKAPAKKATVPAVTADTDALADQVAQMIAAQTVLNSPADALAVIDRIEEVVSESRASVESFLLSVLGGNDGDYGSFSIRDGKIARN